MASEIQVRQFKCDYCECHFETQQEATYHEDLCELISRFVKPGTLLFMNIGVSQYAELQEAAAFCDQIEEFTSERKFNDFVLVEVTWFEIAEREKKDTYQFVLKCKVLPGKSSQEYTLTDNLSGITRVALIERLKTYLTTGILQMRSALFFHPQVISPNGLKRISDQILEARDNFNHAWGKLNPL